MPVLFEGRDKAAEADLATVGEELGDLGDSANVLPSVLRGEAEVVVEAGADVVAVEAVGGDAQIDEKSLELKSDRGLAGTRQSRQPNGAAPETADCAKGSTTLQTRHVVRLEGDVRAGLKERISDDYYFFFNSL